MFSIQVELWEEQLNKMNGIILQYFQHMTGTGLHNQHNTHHPTATTVQSQYCWFIHVCYKLLLYNSILTEFLTHVLKDKVNVVVILCLYHIYQLDHILVVCKSLKKGHFTVCPLRISGIAKGVENLLHCHYLSRVPVHCLPHNAICLKMNCDNAYMLAV